LLPSLSRKKGGATVKRLSTALPKGQLAWFEPQPTCPIGQENLVLTPSMLASYDIKLIQIDQHRQSRTGLLPSAKESEPGDRNRPEF
jgi:hypothetical protein